MSSGTLNNPFGIQNFPGGRRVWGQFFDFDKLLDVQAIAVTTISTSTVKGAVNWLIAGTGSEVWCGTTTIADATVKDSAEGGECTLTTQASTPASDDYVAIQHCMENYQLGLGVEVLFIAKAKMSEATNADMVLGLAIHTGTCQITGVTTNFATDLVAFSKDDGDTQIDFVWKKNATTNRASYNSEANIGTLDTSYHVYAFRIVMDKTVAGKGQIEAWIDGEKVNWPSGGQKLQVTTLCEDEELALSAGVAVGTTSAAQRTLTLDYIGAVQRPAA